LLISQTGRQSRPIPKSMHPGMGVIVPGRFLRATPPRPIRRLGVWSTASCTSTTATTSSAAGSRTSPVTSSRPTPTGPRCST